MKGRWIEVLVWSAIALTVVIFGRQLWVTDLGFDEHVTDGRRIVTEVDPGGAADRAGLAVGDEIVQDPGLITWADAWTEREVYEWSYRLHRAIERGSVPIRLRRDGGEMEIDVRPDPAPSFGAAVRRLRIMGPQLPTAIAFLAVAALLARRPSRAPNDERARRIVIASCAFFGPCWVIQTPSAGWPLWLFPVSNLIDVFSGALGVGLLTLFAWSYPTRSALVDRPVVRLGVPVLGALAGAFSVASSMHLIGQVPLAIRGNGAIIIFDSILVVALVAGIVWQRRRAVDVVARRQTGVLLVAFAVGLFVPILFLIVPRHVFGWTHTLLHAFLFPFPLLVPVGIAAVVARYRLFSIDAVALRAGAYAIAVGVALLVCLALTAGLEGVFQWRGGAKGEAAQWVGIVAAVLLAEPIRRGVHLAVDRLFARDRDAFLRRCAALAARLAGASDAATVEAEVCAALDATTARIVDLAEVLDREAIDAIRPAVESAGAVRVLDLPDPVLADALTERGFELVVFAPSDASATPAMPVLALTLPGPAHQLGRPERDALALVGKVIGASLAQRAAQRALEAELLRSAEERRHIAMELHDGLGATLTAARLMARRLRVPSASAEAGTLTALETTLREGLGDLRASLSSLDPGDASWGGFTARLARQSAERCAAAGIEFSTTTGGDPGPLSPAARLALTRVVQEGVNNALKHASPSRVDVRFDVVGGSLEVAIEDDGAGLSPEAAPETIAEGRGIGNMRRRIESLGGALRLVQRAAGGLRVEAEIPLGGVTVSGDRDNLKRLPP